MKFTWARLEKKSGYWLGLTYSEADPILIDDEINRISEWCGIVGVGRRMAYDMFQFRTEKEMTAFLLRWA